MEIILDYIGGAGRQRQVGHYEFKASLICFMTSRLARATQVRSSLQNQKETATKRLGVLRIDKAQTRRRHRGMRSHVGMIRAQECHCHQELEKARDTRLSCRILLTPTWLSDTDADIRPAELYKNTHSFALVFWNKGSHSSGWPRIPHIARDGH